EQPSVFATGSAVRVPLRQKSRAAAPLSSKPARSGQAGAASLNFPDQASKWILPSPYHTDTILPSYRNRGVAIGYEITSTPVLELRQQTTRVRCPWSRCPCSIG